MNIYINQNQKDYQKPRLALSSFKKNKQRTMFEIQKNQSLYKSICQNEKIYEIQSQESNLSINDFQILKELGKGKFGHVLAVRQKKTDYIVALKRMAKSQLSSNNFFKQIKRQIIIQTSLKNDNILKMFGYFWDSQNVYLILEYAPGGQIYHLLKQYKRFSEKNVSVIIRQVCDGLKYLHSKNIIHRDIKPQNLLLSLKRIKIADFGWSIHSHKKRQTLCGTLDYLAPQMVKGSTHDCTVDVWGVGILAYELAIGRPPFQTDSYDETYSKIINAQVSFPAFISFQLRRFIRRCLQKNPNKRITIEQCLSDQFIRLFQKQELDFQKQKKYLS